MICLYMWIEWLIVVDIEFICQKSYMWICCVFGEKVMNGEVVVCWIWNEFMDICCWWCLKHVDDELVWWLCHWWINDESCWWCWIFMKVWWNFEFGWIGGLIHEFWAFVCMYLCTWPINIIWDEFWVWKDQNWSVWEKGFWNSKFFFWMSARLSVRQANLKRACPVQFWTQFAWANHERSVSEHKCRFCNEFAWASRERAPNKHAQDILTHGRLSEPDVA